MGKNKLGLLLNMKWQIALYTSGFLYRLHIRHTAYFVRNKRRLINKYILFY